MQYIYVCSVGSSTADHMSNLRFYFFGRSMHVWVENRNRWNESNRCQVLCSEDYLSEYRHRHSHHVLYFLLVAPIALCAEYQGSIM